MVRQLGLWSGLWPDRGIVAHIPSQIVWQDIQGLVNRTPGACKHKRQQYGPKAHA